MAAIGVGFYQGFSDLRQVIQKKCIYKSDLGQKAGILGNSITEMKAQECAYLHNANSIIILIL